MKENNVSIIAIFEHKINEGLAKRVILKFAPGWRYKENYKLIDKGGIWVVWDPKYVDCTVEVNLSNKYNSDI